ncbi:nitrite reductase large subunit NirB [Paenibacillus turpanensis]|uniref:nitrite reductase large subunit NirB n=1 Tax=Paenibacillus turpanensis TaxID=2689078 RepID=UPI00140D2529|nr:nitrite reductase large subunit NirB [Paenibacillus turpanensis]
MGKRKLVVIGNGMAGVRCVEEILSIDRNAFDITIFGKEPHPNYNRIMLSKVLQGDTSVHDITINDWQWYKENGIHLYTNETISSIDTARKIVTAESGRTAEYDELIIATGSLPFMLPLPGANKAGVTAFRNIQDCETMVETSQKYKKAVVIGGGLLGLEAGRGLLNLGMKVDVVHIFDSIMERQLDPTAAKMLQLELERQGMNFLLEKHSEEIIGRSRVSGLRFKDGTMTEADLVVMAVGIRPNIQLAKDSGIETNRAIVVDDYMQTSVPGVYAVGECAEHRGLVYGLVAPLYEQGKVLAKTLCGVESAGYHGSVLATQLKVSGVDVFSAGEFTDSDEVQTLKWYDGLRGTYKKIVVRDGKLVGAVLFGDTSESSKLLGYIKEQKDISVYEKEMNGTGGGPAAGLDFVASMSDKDIVCSCNGVSKGAIVQAIQERGLETVDEIKKCTKASSSCGSCRTMVGSILEYVKLHGFGQQEEKQTLCGCTLLSQEEIVAAIQRQGFSSKEETMSALQWGTPDGCPVCLPALQYYVGIHGGSAPSEGGAGRAAPDQQEPEAPRTGYAALQADGTYAISPRFYGGVITADQLRRLADVVEKYEVPLVKLLEGPQLALFGIPKETVSSVKVDLNMEPSGAAARYGKTIGAVSACGGQRYAPDAIRDSVALGAALERRLARLQLPQEVAVGVSASPRNDARPLTKDIGLVGVPGGWDLYVGGSSRKQVKEGQLLCTLATDEEALTAVMAFLQFYRETAVYAETVLQWVERMGLQNIREALFDPFVLQLLISRAGSGNAAYLEQINQQPAAAVIR